MSILDAILFHLVIVALIIMALFVFSGVALIALSCFQHISKLERK